MHTRVAKYVGLSLCTCCIRHVQVLYREQLASLMVLQESLSGWTMFNVREQKPVSFCALIME